MKTILATTCLLLILALPSTTKAAFVETKTENGQINSGNSQTQLLQQLQVLAEMSRKQYEELTGQHLNLAERILFRISQRHLQKELQNYQATGVLPEQFLNKFLGPNHGRGTRTTLFVVIIILLLLLLIIPIALIGKWN